jgi:hypothetical protein
MSWEQNYAVPNVQNLLEKLTGCTSFELLKEELACQGILIVKEEEILLDSGFYQEVKGTKITLSDGRVFVPKLTEQLREDGNYGLDVYEYVLESETPEVLHTGNDNEEVQFPRTLPDCGNCDACEQGYGCEYPSDSEDKFGHECGVDEAVE